MGEFFLLLRCEDAVFGFFFEFLVFFDVFGLDGGEIVVIFEFGEGLFFT